MLKHPLSAFAKIRTERTSNCTRTLFVFSPDNWTKLVFGSNVLEDSFGEGLLAEEILQQRMLTKKSSLKYLHQRISEE